MQEPEVRSCPLNVLIADSRNNCRRQPFRLQSFQESSPQSKNYIHWMNLS